MTEYRDMDERLEAFVTAYEKGDGNPLPFMEGLDEPGRRRFRVRIEQYLKENPEPVFNPERLNDERLKAMARRTASRLDGVTGSMSQLVIELRGRKGLLQEDVVEALAEDFDASRDEKEKIDDYYHDLEFGTLSAKGISDRVLDSLAALFGTTRDALRKAGEALGPSGSPSGGLLFARMADNSEEVFDGQASPAMEVPAGESRKASPPDRIDELFTGG